MEQHLVLRLVVRFFQVLLEIEELTSKLTGWVSCLIQFTYLKGHREVRGMGLGGWGVGRSKVKEKGDLLGLQITTLVLLPSIQILLTFGTKPVPLGRI